MHRRERSQLTDSWDYWPFQINSIRFSSFVFKLFKPVLHLSPSASCSSQNIKCRLMNLATTLSNTTLFVPGTELNLEGGGKGKGEAMERWIKQGPCSPEAIKSHSSRVYIKNELTSWEFCSNESRIKTSDLASGPASWTFQLTKCLSLNTIRPLWDLWFHCLTLAATSEVLMEHNKRMATEWGRCFCSQAES
jgi:hypothetical protein